MTFIHVENWHNQCLITNALLRHTRLLKGQYRHDQQGMEFEG